MPAKLISRFIEKPGRTLFRGFFSKFYFWLSKRNKRTKRKRISGVRFTGRMLRRAPDAIVFVGLALGALVGRADLVWPHFTVSDILESGGGRLVYTSWALALAAEYAINGRVYRGGIIAMMWPLFRVPHGTPAVPPIAEALEGALAGERVANAPQVAPLIAHFAWASAFVAAQYAPVRLRATLAGAFVSLTIVGTVARIGPLVALACCAEIVLLCADSAYRPAPVPRDAVWRSRSE
jgi:hypothetical protein